METTGGDKFSDKDQPFTLSNGDYLAMVIYNADNGLYGVSAADYITGIIADPPTAGGLLNISFQNDRGLNPDGSPYMVADTAIAAIPEPTSGLLLLLGVAGLALRRRRA